MDNRYSNLKLEIESLETNIKKGLYEGENLLTAKDLLKTKRDELSKLAVKKVKPVENAPIKGLREKTVKTASQMSGGLRGI